MVLMCIHDVEFAVRCGIVRCGQDIGCQWYHYRKGGLPVSHGNIISAFTFTGASSAAKCVVYSIHLWYEAQLLL